MPVIDMPLEQLREYNGINPCPKDFDDYWDKALLEMRNTEPQVAMVKSEFQVLYADCFDLYFTGVKGARIQSPKSMIIYPNYGHEMIPGINDEIFTFMIGL